MNYKAVQKKSNKGKVAIIVVCLIMMIALAASASFIVYKQFIVPKDDNKLPSDNGIHTVEAKRAKEVFEDTKLLDISDLEDLSDIYFPVEDFSYSGFEETFGEKTFYLGVINLHKSGFGNEFNVPEVGDYYRFDIEFNGEELGATRMDIVKYGKDRIEGNVIYNAYKEEEVVIYFLPYFYTESTSPFVEVLISADLHATDKTLLERHEALVVDGYCLVVTSLQPIESLKFLHIEELLE